MAFCANCGSKIPEGGMFCVECGTPVAAVAPVAPVASNAAEEQEFLDVTHRLLRWEQKAWKIAGIVFTIVGAAFAAIFSLVALIGVMLGEDGEFFTMFFFLYAILYGGIFLALGFINTKAAGKIPAYLSRMYTDFKFAEDRCGSVGMMVFTIFFNEVALVFFIINFVRMKSNKPLIERIVAKQRGM